MDGWMDRQIKRWLGGWMAAASVRGEVGEEDVGHFYSFIKRPVVAPSFLKPSQPFPQGYEDLSSC